MIFSRYSFLESLFVPVRERVLLFTFLFRQADYVPRPERTRSTGSVGGGSSRPPSSGPTRGVPTRQPNAPHQRHPNSIPVSTSQFRPSMPNRPSMSPGFPSDLTNRSLLGNNLALSQASLPPHMSQQSTAELQYALHHQSQVKVNHFDIFCKFKPQIYH